jgi:hypothetical protein
MSVLHFASNAHADPATIWSMNAASCTPAQPAGTNYAISAGAVTNLIAHQQYFYCPIAYNLRQLNGTSNTLTLHFSGTSNYPCGGLCTQPHYVVADLVAMSRTTGAETIVATAASFSSSTFATVTTGFSYTYDFDANVYYVRIHAEGTTSWPQNVYAVALKDS